MKTVITENQRGLKFKNGRFTEALSAGKYRTFCGTEIEVLDLHAEVLSANADISVLMKNESFSAAVDCIEVPDGHIALHYVDGKFKGAVRSGRHAFWRELGEHTFKVCDMGEPEIPCDIPEHIIKMIPPMLCDKVEVYPYTKARLYYNKRFKKLLDSGVYYFWKGSTAVDTEEIPTEAQLLTIIGQEILTQDKVTLRINFVVNYKISDFISVQMSGNSAESQLHVLAQLALREHIGKYRLDEILENKEDISRAVLDRLREKQGDIFVEIISADIKDIILPGEIRDIMNTVLVAEKKAQASVITRREEVASTRSLLNTAKLMEDNPTLYRLKELEYVERICENVGNITLNGTGDILSGLTSLIGARK